MSDTLITKTSTKQTDIIALKQDGLLTRRKHAGSPEARHQSLAECHQNKSDTRMILCSAREADHKCSISAASSPAVASRVHAELAGNRQTKKL